MAGDGARQRPAATNASRQAFAESERVVAAAQSARDVAVDAAERESRSVVSQALLDAVTEAFEAHRDEIRALGRHAGRPTHCMATITALNTTRCDGRGGRCGTGGNRTTGGIVSDDQKTMAAVLSKAGYMCRVCKGADEAIGVITEYVEGAA